MIENKTDVYLTLKEISVNYDLSRYKADKLVSNNSKISTIVKQIGKKTIRTFSETDIENHFARVEKAQQLDFVENDGYTEQEITLENYLIEQQEYFGGSTSKAVWNNFSPVRWEPKTNIQHSKENITERLFYDTLIVSIPVVCLVENGGSKVFVTEKSRLDATNILKRHFKDIVTKWTGDIHSLTVTDISIKSNNLRLSETTRQVLVIPKRNNVNIKKLNLDEKEQYIAYQNFRLSSSNCEFKRISSIIEKINKSDFLILDNPVLVSRFDITSNLGGAVKSYVKTPCLEHLGLKAKENKHLVSETTHTYIYMQDTVEFSALEGLDVGNSGKRCIESLELYRDAQEDINNNLNNFNSLDSYKEFLLLNLKVETLTSQNQIIETKIYDKLRFMLECGNVSNRVSGFHSLGNLVDSTKTEIQTAFTELNQQGISRVETRLRGAGVLLSMGMMIDLHYFFCKVLVSKFSHITPFQTSIDSFLDTVKANVGIIVDNGVNASSHYAVSQWVNSVSKRVQGRITIGDKLFIEENDFNNWILYQSNRHVPLVLITVGNDFYQKKGRGKYKIKDVNVIKPTLKGFSNIIVIDGNKTSNNQKAGKPFNGFTMQPFKSSITNSVPRDIGLNRVFTGENCLQKAFVYARENLKAFRFRFKKGTNKCTSCINSVDSIDSNYSLIKTAFLTHIENKKPIRKMVLKAPADRQDGYIMEHNGLVYLARWNKSTTKTVKVFLLKPSDDFQIDKHIPFKNVVTVLSFKGKKYYQILNK